MGPENFFLFGLTEEQVLAKQQAGYRPRDHYESNAELREVIDLIDAGFFCPEDRATLKPLVRSLLEEDRYMVLADFEAYSKAQDEVAKAYADTEGWTRKAILNVARTGWFSSDRTIREYAEEIWGVKPVKVE